MKKILALLLALAAGPALAADNIPVTAGSGTPIRSTDTSVGATGAGPYVNWYTLSTSGAAGTAPTVLYSAAGTSISNGIGIQGVTGGIAVPISGTITANQGSPPWIVTGNVSNASSGVATSSSNVGSIGYNYVFNGTTWDRLLGTSGATQVVCNSGCTNSAITTWAGSTLGAISNYGTSPGTVLVPSVNAFVTNANLNGRNTSINSSPVVPSAAPTTSVTVNVSGASATATLIKGSSATLMSCQAGNINATPVYVHIFNKATAPTPGTDSAIKTLIVPGNTNGAGSNVVFGPGGIALTLGLGITITAGIATIDNTTVTTANTVVVNCDYE